MKQIAATALIIVLAILSLYAGLRFISAQFDNAAKQETRAVSRTTAPSNWTCRVYYGHDGEYVQYDDELICRERAAEGATVIRMWEGRLTPHRK